MKRTKEEINELKNKHRLEDLMQEAGEAFEADAENPDLWHGTVTRGLTVNIRRQTYEYIRPGLETEKGDLIQWLKRRYAWTFGGVVDYLQKRTPAPKQDTPAPSVTVPDVAGEPGEPRDAWQERALEIGGNEIRDLFTWKSEDLLVLRDQQPARFVPVQDMTVEYCDSCEEPINWFWKQPPQFGYLQTFKPGFAGNTWKRVQIIPEPEVYAFECEEWGEVICICRECKIKKINYRQALEYLYRSARSARRRGGVGQGDARLPVEWESVVIL